MMGVGASGKLAPVGALSPRSHILPQATPVLTTFLVCVTCFCSEDVRRDNSHLHLDQGSSWEACGPLQSRFVSLWLRQTELHLYLCCHYGPGLSDVRNWCYAQKSCISCASPHDLKPCPAAQQHGSVQGNGHCPSKSGI